MASMAGPTNHQRRVLASIVGRDSLSGGTFAFCSPELLGLEPEVYREEFLDDLVLLEAADEENDPLERFGVRWVLRLFRAFGGCKMVSSSPCCFHHQCHTALSLHFMSFFLGYTTAQQLSRKSFRIHTDLAYAHEETHPTGRYRERPRGKPRHSGRSGIPILQEDLLCNK